jgi:hypothetical protein
MVHARSTGLAAALIFLFLFPTVSAAEEEGLDALVSDKKLEEKKKKDGWDFLLTPGISFALSDNRNVIGQQEGYTLTLGINLAAGAFMRFGAHEWRSTLNITEAFNRTPEMERFVKASDIVKLESIYLFHLLEWLGPYARFSMDTALLEGFDRRAEATRWVITRTDGTEDTYDGFNLRLTDGFHPMTLRESVGFFANALSGTKMNIEFRLGFGGLHAIADDQLTVTDDGGTPAVEVTGLRSYNQAGGELGAFIRGELYEKRVNYKISAEFMMPFVNDLQEGDDRGIAELTNIELNASISFKLLAWLTIDYVFRAVKQPQLLDEFQIQNNLLLTASYTFFKPEEEKK